MPELYNQHYINKYSFPKGLSCIRKDPNTEAKRPRQTDIIDLGSHFPPREPRVHLLGPSLKRKFAHLL